MIEFDSLKHEYKINGVSVPSVTKVLGNRYYRHNPEAMARGSKVNMLTEMYDMGNLDLDFLVGTEYFGYVSAWVDFKKVTGIKILKREYIVGSELYMCAGTIDVLGIIDDRCLIDIKSGSKHRNHGLQLTGYKLFSEDKDKIKKLFGVYLRPNGKYSLVEYDYTPHDFIKLIDEYRG